MFKLMQFQQRTWLVALVLCLIAGLACNTLTGGDDPESASPTPNDLIVDESPVPDEPEQPGEEIPAEPTDLPSIDTGSDACNHPYYPGVEGATWTYASDDSTFGAYEYTDLITNVRSDAFTLVSQFDELERNQQWSCSAEGLTALTFSGPGGAGSVATTGMNAEFETTDVSGITLPASITPGDTWTQTFSISGVQEMADGPSATTEGEVQMAFEALRIEPLTVAAGSFENALVIAIEFNMQFTVHVEGFELPTEFSTIGTAWYAPGVGLVKTESSGSLFEEGYTETIELTSYNIP